MEKNPQPPILKPVKPKNEAQEPIPTSPPENKTLTKTQS